MKITSKGGAGVGGEVLRVIESLGFEITYTALDQIKPMHLLTTVFIRVSTLLSTVLILDLNPNIVSTNMSTYFFELDDYK